MFDFRNYYKTLNVKINKEYVETLDHIKVIKEKTGKKGNKYNDYFYKTASFMILMANFEKNLNEDYFIKNNFDQLLKENHAIFEDVTGNNYNTSYANPRFAAKKFGKEIGQLLASLYGEIRHYVSYAYQHRVFDMYVINDIFIRVYEYVINNNKINPMKLKGIITSDARERLELKRELWVRETFTPEISYNADIVRECDFTDLRYLFRYGRYITDNEIDMAKFVNELDESKVKEVAKTFTEGFIEGYRRDKNKDIKSKTSVGILFHLGEERIAREAIENFNQLQLSSFSKTLFSTEPNKQFAYDHRFDEALYFDNFFTQLFDEATKKALELLKDHVKGYAGPAVLEQFGEIPFKPESKEECIKLSPEQNQLKQNHLSNISMIINDYAPRSQWSFTIMALPIPDIGDKFKEIFEATCVVNTLDSQLYERIQQTIIDTLDQGDYVHVKGKDGNETDIKVALQTLEDPANQTNFNNCVADVNIPVGEVFTSPQLQGTNGILHVEEVYLRDLKYVDLKLTFKDGFIEEYSCNNFKTEEENRKYMEENLLFPHKTLPLGEFAIGTNTAAYVMANKYDIVDILPILIVEKMGPHFAVGDTCYSRSEDQPVYNSNKKEIMSRDNEKSIKRLDNPSEAYTNVHTDITLPYDGLAYIQVVKASGDTLDIIKDGRFVLEGTEELNKAFEE